MGTAALGDITFAARGDPRPCTQVSAAIVDPLLGPRPSRREGARTAARRTTALSLLPRRDRVFPAGVPVPAGLTDEGAALNRRATVGPNRYLQRHSTQR
jgi:hypothetical protein